MPKRTHVGGKNHLAMYQREAKCLWKGFSKAPCKIRGETLRGHKNDILKIEPHRKMQFNVAFGQFGCVQNIFASQPVNTAKNLIYLFFLMFAAQHFVLLCSIFVFTYFSV